MYEANFRLMLESAPDGIVIVDAEGLIILVNLAAELLFGYAREELLGQPVEMLIEADRGKVHPELRNSFVQSPQSRPMASGRHLTVLRKDGSVCAVEVRLTPLKMPSGSATMATVIDITERRKAEAELRRSEARFRAIAENFPGVIFQRVTYPDGRLEYPYVSPSLERIFGLPAESLLSVRSEQDLAKFIHPDDQQTVMTRLRQAAAAPAPVEFEGRVRGSDGEVRWLRSISRPTPGPEGSVVWDGVMLDVTERRRAQQQLAERTKELETAKRKLEALVSGTSEIVWTVNPDGVAEEDSPSRRAFTGETLEEWLSGGCYDVIHPDDRAETARLWADARQTGVGFTNEYRLRHQASGEWRWMRVDRVPLHDEEGVLTGWVGMNKDITEEKQAKEQLELVNSELSHRIKNLLSIIIAIAQETGKRAARTSDFVSDFRSRLEGLARSHDVLVKGKWEAVDLDELVRSHLESFVTGSPSARVRVSGPPLKIKAEVAQTLGMAFHELATNAVKYGALSNADGRIDVEWTVGGNGHNNGQFALKWTETGGPVVTRPHSAGYGSIVVTKLAGRAINGEANLQFKETGVQWVLNAPAHFLADGS